MSTQARPFNHPSNRYIIDNNDPEAFDKRFKGIAGSHVEYQCCRNRAPYMTSTYVKGAGHDDRGRLISQYPSVQRGDFLDLRVYNSVQRKEFSEGSHPGLSDAAAFNNFTYLRDELWCSECATWAESARDDVMQVVSDSVPVWRGLAMVASYIPVIGTAVSFVINTAVTLAETGEIGEALLDGIAGAIPGQPTSGMVFNTVRAIARGDRFDKALMVGAMTRVGVPSASQKLILGACDILEDVATGRRVDEVVMARLREALPASAQKLMDLGQGLVNGDAIEDIVLQAADAATHLPGSGALETARQFREAALAAKAQGEAAVENFLSQIAFAGSVLGLDEDLRGALMMGVIGGSTEKIQLIGTFGSVPEKNVAENDSFLQKGQRIVDRGAKWRQKPLSEWLNGSTLSLSVDSFDAVNSVWIRRFKTYPIDAAWRRGFLIGLAVCEGSTERGAGQTAVYQTMAEAGGRGGFEAGQEVAHQMEGGLFLNRPVSSIAAKFSLASVLGPRPKPPPPIQFLKTAMPSVFTEDGQRVIAEQKRTERAYWVSYYKNFAENP